MNQQQLVSLKLGIVGVVLVGGFILAGIGRLDATQMYHDTTMLVGALAVALGISGAGSAAQEAVSATVRARLAASDRERS